LHGYLHVRCLSGKSGHTVEEIELVEHVVVVEQLITFCFCLLVAIQTEQQHKTTTQQNKKEPGERLAAGGRL
jgi:hypothetical protein